MKPVLAFLLAATIAAAQSAPTTTINSVHRFSHGANFGWMDWHGRASEGAVVGEFVCSGFVYAANAGWIHLGDGTPADGIYYRNNAAGDFGVNHDGTGILHGFAYGANLGWLAFTNRDATGAVFDGPKVDLATGRMSGWVWSANGGWITLASSQAFVQTDSMQRGEDSDGDGITDAWELSRLGDLSTADGTSDFDQDNFTDAREYRADTNPTDPASYFAITAFTAQPGGAPATLTWSSQRTRLYHVQRHANLDPVLPWSDLGFGLIVPDAGSSTTRTFTDSAAPPSFYRIEAIQPLAP